MMDLEAMRRLNITSWRTGNIRKPDTKSETSRIVVETWLAHIHSESFAIP